MAETRKKSLSVIYNGTEAWSELFPVMDRFTYNDSVDQSDTISFEISDRDQKWIKGWIPERGDIIEPCIKTENWNYEGERLMLLCGSFVVDDFSFSAATLRGSINGVSAPVDSCFKETQNTKTWENATVQLIAGEFAAKYGLSLVFDAEDIQVEKTEQSKQTDSDFLKQICEKYGLGYKVYAKRLGLPPVFCAGSRTYTVTGYRAQLEVSFHHAGNIYGGQSELQKSKDQEDGGCAGWNGRKALQNESEGR